jgi:2-pyrone-4,6-dicarboxylate lactonase
MPIATYLARGPSFLTRQSASTTPCDASKAQLFALRDHLGLIKTSSCRPPATALTTVTLVDALIASNGKARGVATVKRSVSDAELQAMHPGRCAWRAL